MRVRLWSVVVLIMAAWACAEPLPTAPTVAREPGALRWDIVAPGCTVDQPVPALAGVMPTSRFALGDGVRATWLLSESGRRSEFIVADFRPVGDVFGLCTWAHATREAIE